jgi:protein-disulfide isomerase
MSTTVWEAALALPVSEDRDHIRGPQNAPVTLLKYGDYECPYCGAAHKIVTALLARMGDDVRFVFRHFPLSTVHPHAEQAAEAAEAAGAQGKFWAMHDMLYENQDQLDAPSLLTYADAVGVDVEQFTTELLQHVHAPKIREDFISGVRSGVNGTPTFYIDGVRHDGSWDAASLWAALESAVEESGRRA